ncbi:MAG: hypothetical protein L0Y73_04465, partial [Candidatus Aminicenantes bacterium]|nr:hypothetical protein [Candidatus Aminicenantes bacterium]
GKAGEGPQEFMLRGGAGLMVFPYKDYLLINSLGKISYFSKDGKFQKEVMTRSPMMIGYFQPTPGGDFAGLGFTFDNDKQSAFMTLNLYDEKFTKIKEIARQKFFSRGRLEFPMIIPVFIVDGNSIFMAGETGFVMNKYDLDGNKKVLITRDYSLLKVTGEYKEKVHNFFKTNPASKAAYENIKNMITFLDRFPAIYLFQIDSKKIYIITYLEEKGKYETFIYGTDGKFIKRLFLPINYQNVMQADPYTFYKNKFYHLIENEDTEQWELHAIKIE